MVFGVRKILSFLNNKNAKCQCTIELNSRSSKNIKNVEEMISFLSGLSLFVGIIYIKAVVFAPQMGAAG